MEPVREHPQPKGRGSLRRAVAEMATWAREHPGALDADAGGRVHMFRLGPYCDAPSASTAARTLRKYGPEHDGEVECFTKHYDGRPYVVARFIPGPALNLFAVS